MPQISFSRLLILVAVVCLVFLTHLGSARLWDRDEPRNSRASHEMLERSDWIVPTFNGELRDHKPILLYWGQMVSYLTIGESEFAARLPSALCAILTVFAVAILASRLSGHANGITAEGFWAAGALATCLLFVMAGRAATPDACLIAFSTLGIAALVIASLRPSHPYGAGRVGSARWLPAAVGYLMLGLAALAKGPVGIILPLAVVHAWWMVCKRAQDADAHSASNPQVDSSVHANAFIMQLGSYVVATVREAWACFNPLQCWRAIWALKAIPGLVLCLLAAAPWYYAVGVETNGAFLRGFFLDHNVGRAVNSMEGHGGSIFFYPAAFLAGTFPWSLWLIPMLMWAKKAAVQSPMQRQTVILAVAWVGVYLSAFTIASTKLPSYITPCYAGSALVIGGFWKHFESTFSLPSWNWRRVAYAITAVFGVVITVTILWLSQQEAMPLLSRAAWAGAVICGIGAGGFLLERMQRTTWVPLTWLVGAAAFQIILFGYGAKSVDRYRADLQTLVEADQSNPSEHWLSIGGMEPSWVHYLDNKIEEIRTSPQDQASWVAVRDFLDRHPDGKVIAVGDEANAMLISRTAELTNNAPFRQLVEGKRFLRPGNLAVYSRCSDTSDVLPESDDSVKRIGQRSEFQQQR